MDTGINDHQLALQDNKKPCENVEALFYFLLSSNGTSRDLILPYFSPRRYG